jgi:hypothetical protein
MSADYIPTPGPLEGERWEPSNGTEGACFHEAWCCNCERDKDMNGTCQAEGRDAGDDDWCPSLGASYRGEAVEWREMPTGEVKCIAFVPVGQQVPLAPCEHTQDLFGSAQ